MGRAKEAGALETARRTRGTGAQLEAEPALEGIFAAIRTISGNEMVKWMTQSLEAWFML